MRMKLVVLTAAAGLILAARAPAVMAAAETHRFNIVLSAVPTQIKGGDYNDLIGEINRTQLESRGLEPLDIIDYSWLIEAEARYFVRPNLAVTVGAGRIRKSVQQEYLPSINQSIIISSNITSIPLHVGAAYYLRPYNQGDFQARAFLGAGMMSVVYNRASVRVQTIGIALPPGAPTGFGATNDAPGFYGEVGAHLFFASRYSVLLGALYRSNEVHNLINEDDGQPLYNLQGEPASFDAGGIGFRMALGIGF